MKIPVWVIFAGFISWLLSFAMEGPLVSHSGIENALLYFIIPHIVALYVLSLVRYDYDITIIADSGIVLSALSTVFFFYSGDYAAIFMILAGIGSAPVLMRIGGMLGDTNGKLFQVFSGLVAGNIATGIVINLPSGVWSYFAVAIALSLSFSAEMRVRSDSLKDLYIYQPMLLVLYTMAGIMYGFLMPGYYATEPLPGSEIFFYILAITLGWYFFAKDINGLLYLAIAFAILSQPALYSLTETFFVSGLYFMQSSMGFADYFALALAVSQTSPARAVGLNSATVCLGILIGFMLSQTHFEIITIVAFLGNITLAAGIFLLMFIQRHKKSGAVIHGSSSQIIFGPSKDADVEQKIQLAEKGSERFVCIPEWITDKLSPRECQILEMVIVKGMLYREVAEEIGIAESTVKTYIQRIYTKMEVESKKDLKKICQCLDAQKNNQ